MSYRGSTGAVALAAALMVTIGGARAANEAKYPNWKGQWDTINPRFGGQTVKFDPNKAFGPAQQAPLTPEYQKIHEESMADQAKGGQGNFIDHARCVPGGMPSMMSAQAAEYIVTPETTYISVNTDLRRIFTDGRPWPTDVEPTYQGYSIGKWIDEDGDGVYDVLEVETRGPFKGPRAYDATGLPLHFDNQSTFKERFHLDKNDPNLLHDEITVFDHALTRPWSVDKTFRRNPNPVSELEPGFLHRGHQLCRHRNRRLFPERGRILDADQKGSGAAGCEIFQATDVELTAVGRRPARVARRSVPAGEPMSEHADSEHANSEHASGGAIVPHGLTRHVRVAATRDDRRRNRADTWPERRRARQCAASDPVVRAGPAGHCPDPGGGRCGLAPSSHERPL